jgi:hypothetical protein
MSRFSSAPERAAGVGGSDLSIARSWRLFVVGAPA